MAKRGSRVAFGKARIHDGSGHSAQSTSMNQQILACLLPLSVVACQGTAGGTSSTTSAHSPTSSVASSSSSSTGAHLGSTSGTIGSGSTTASASGASSTGSTSGGTTTGVPPVSTLAGGGGVTCLDAGFDSVTDVRLGPSGIYVIGGQLYSVASDGTITTVIASSVLPALGFMAIGSTGTLFVSARDAHSFSEVYQIDGSMASLLAGAGDAVCGDTGFDAGVGFGAISGMLVDPSGGDPQ